MQDKRLSNAQQRNLKQTFESIAVKFLLNLPSQEKLDKVRLSYHYKKAYYYYIDEVFKDYFPLEDPKKVDLNWFLDELNKVAGQYMKKVDAQKIIKILGANRPTCGAIILNERQNKVLLIQSYGKYGFPKGGKNENETAEDCAARQVREQVGIFIHSKINSNEKVQFAEDGVLVTYFIVRKFDENEELRIDKKQIDRAFWMNIEEVSKRFDKLTKKSKFAWRGFQNSLKIPSNISMDDFLNAYREKQGKCKEKDKEKQSLNINPLLNFSFDRERIRSIMNDFLIDDQ